MLKVNMSIAIVCMVNNTALSQLNSISHNSSIASLYSRNDSSEETCSGAISHHKIIVNLNIIKL